MSEQKHLVLITAGEYSDYGILGLWELSDDALSDLRLIEGKQAELVDQYPAWDSPEYEIHKAKRRALAQAFVQTVKSGGNSVEFQEHCTNVDTYHMPWPEDEE